MTARGGFLLLLGLALGGSAMRATPEDEVRAAVQRLNDVPIFSWEKGLGTQAQEDNRKAPVGVVFPSPILSLRLGGNSLGLVTARGRQERTGFVYTEVKEFGQWYPSYRSASSSRVALTPEGWWTQDEIGAALRPLQGKVQYVKFMGRQVDLQSCLLAALRAISQPAPLDELTGLVGHITAFRTEGTMIAGDLEPAFVAGHYLPRGTSAADVQHAEIQFWIVHGELTRYAIDVAAVNHSPRPGRPADIKAQWTVALETQHVAPIAVPADAVEKLGP